MKKKPDITLTHNKRFIKDNSGAFQSLYKDTVSGLNFGVLTIGRGKRRKNVYHIYSDDYTFSTKVNSFKEAKDYLIKNFDKQWS